MREVARLMPTLGEELRRMREERRITLAEISEATRIGTRFLKAIENDNFSVLPGGIFTRSFIRAYAKQVGMGEDEAISRYQQQVTGAVPEPASEQSSSTQSSSDKREKPAAPEPVRHKAEPVTFKQSPARTNWGTVVIAGAILLFVGAIVLGVVRQLNKASSESASQAASATRPPEIPRDPVPVGTPSTTASTPTPSPTTATPPANPEPPPSQPPSGTAETITVRLEATTNDSAIQYWVDDAPKATTFTLKKGESQNLPVAQSQIKLSIGNRPALKMKINNRDAVFPEGTPNWGAKVTISRDNLKTFFQ